MTPSRVVRGNMNIVVRFCVSARYCDTIDRNIVTGLLQLTRAYSRQIKGAKIKFEKQGMYDTMSA